jgi:flagellar hook-length control protein FliK
MIDVIGVPATPAPAEARTTSTETRATASFGEVLAQAQVELPAEAELVPTEAEQALAATTLMLALATVTVEPAAELPEGGQAAPALTAATAAPYPAAQSAVAPTPAELPAAAEGVEPAHSERADQPEKKAAIPFAALLGEGAPAASAEAPPAGVSAPQLKPATERPEPVKVAPSATPAAPTPQADAALAPTLPQPAAEGVAVSGREPPPGPAPVAERDRAPSAPPAMHTAPHTPTPEPARLAEAQLKTSPRVSAEVVWPQIVGQVETLLRSGESSMRVQLQPESLGRIELQVTANASGMHVRITTDLPLTGGLIERHLPDLRDALTQAGLTVSGLSVNVGGDGAEAQRQPNPFAGQPRPLAGRLPAEVENDGSLSAEMMRVPARPASGSQVDFRI